MPLLLFAIIYLNYYRDQVLVPINKPLALEYILIAIVCVLAALLAYYDYRKNLKLAIGEGRLRAKLNLWHQALVRNYLFMGLLSFTAVVILYFSKSQLFVACYALLLFIVSLLRPTQQRLIRELKLKSEDLKMVENNEEVPP